jgi:hypothetical protein
MKKIMFITFSFLLTAGVSAFAQNVVKVAKDSTTTTVITSTKPEPVKTEIMVPKDSTTTTVTSSVKVEPVKTEINSADLPKPVLDLGASFKTQGWDTAEKAYVLKSATGDVIFYVVTYKDTKTGEIKSINIDAKGNIVKE